MHRARFLDSEQPFLSIATCDSCSRPEKSLFLGSSLVRRPEWKRFVNSGNLATEKNEACAEGPIRNLKFLLAPQRSGFEQSILQIGARDRQSA